MPTLTPTERQNFKAAAHALQPVVSISENGLSESVLKEIDRSLNAHELIKIRVYSDDRQQRETWLSEICEKLKASPVQHIGKLLVVWRHNPEKARAEKNRKPVEPRRTKRSHQG